MTCRQGNRQNHRQNAVPALLAGRQLPTRASRIVRTPYFSSETAVFGSAALKKRNGIGSDLDFCQSCWRAVIAPYVFPEQGVTSYRLDQSWQSENNRKGLLSFLVFSVHRCPLDPTPVGHPFFTSYLMLVRSPVKDSETGAMKAPTLATDAVLIVESVDCGVQFAEPRDLSWDDLWKGDSPFGKGKLNSFHPKVVKALRVDGKVIDIPKDISKEELRKLLNGTPTNGDTGR